MDLISLIDVSEPIVTEMRELPTDFVGNFVGIDKGKGNTGVERDVLHVKIVVLVGVSVQCQMFWRTLIKNRQDTKTVYQFLIFARFQKLSKIALWSTT